MNKYKSIISIMIIILLVQVLFVPLIIFANENENGNDNENVSDTFDMELSELPEYSGNNFSGFKTAINNEDNNQNYVIKATVNILRYDGSEVRFVYYFGLEDRKGLTVVEEPTRSFKIIFNEQISVRNPSNSSNIDNERKNYYSLGSYAGEPSISSYDFETIWTRSGHEIVPPPIIESRPDIDMPYYVMYANRNYNTVSLQAYEHIPNFVFGQYEDMENLEFDVNWFGRGRMTRYELIGDDWVIKEQTLEGEMWQDYGANRKILMESNHNIIDFIDGTNIGEIEYTSGEKPKILGGSFDYDGYGVKFLSPRNGFKDNSFIFNYQFWFRLPYDDIEGNIYKEDTVIIGFGGDFKEGTRTTDSKSITVKVIDGKKIVEGFYSVSVGHEVGKNTVEVQVKRNNNDKYWSAKLQTERLAGFVDEDGDGLDDRTGRTDNNEEHPWYYDDYKQGGQAPIRDGYDDGILGQVSYYFDTLLFWLLSPFRIIADGISALIDMVNSTFDSVNVFGQLISKLFSFLPSEIVSMLGALFISTIIIALIKVVRK